MIKNLSEFEKKLHSLFSSDIEYFNFNILKNEISLSLKLMKTSHEIEKCELIFINVATFYFLNGGQPKYIEYNRTIPEFAKLFSIFYFPEGYGIVHIIRKYQSFHASKKGYGNFFIEILDSTLLIEAEKIQINGQIFDIGFSPDRELK